MKSLILALLLLSSMNAQAQSMFDDDCQKIMQEKKATQITDPQQQVTTYQRLFYDYAFKNAFGGQMLASKMMEVQKANAGFLKYADTMGTTWVYCIAGPGGSLKPVAFSKELRSSNHNWDEVSVNLTEKYGKPIKEFERFDAPMKMPGSTKKHPGFYVRTKAGFGTVIAGLGGFDNLYQSNGLVYLEENWLKTVALPAIELSKVELAKMKTKADADAKVKSDERKEKLKNSL